MISDLLLKIGKLKSLKRTGWVREGMPDPESVAEHTFRVCFLTFLMADELKVDKDKLLKMSLVHDIEEIETHDPVAIRGAIKTGSHDYAKEKEIVDELGNQEISALWAAGLAKNSPAASRESAVLFQLDRLASCWQALEYELAGVDSKKLDEFWENAHVSVTEPALLDLLKEMEDKRVTGR